MVNATTADGTTSTKSAEEKEVYLTAGINVEDEDFVTTSTISSDSVQG